MAVKERTREKKSVANVKPTAKSKYHGLSSFGKFKKVTISPLDPSKVDPRRFAREIAVTEETQLAGDLMKELEASAATAADVNTLCENYGLKREELGKLTGFSL